MSNRWSFLQPETKRDREQAELRARAQQIQEAASGALPAAEAIALLRDDEAPAAVRRTVLTRPDIPAEVVAEARGMAEPSVRAFAVSLPDTSVDELRRGATDGAWQVRLEVAQHPSTPADLQNLLARDTSSTVRRAVITRPDVLPDVLVDIVLAKGSLPDIELALTQPGLRISDHLDRLLQAREHGATALLKLPELPDSLLHRFAMDDHPDGIREAALRRGAPEEVAVLALHSPRVAVRLAAIEGGNCSEAALTGAARDVSGKVRAAVAASPRTPQAVIDTLLRDPRKKVRVAAAGSRSVSAEVLGMVAIDDAELLVRKTAVANERCPVDVLSVCCTQPDLVVVAVANPSCPIEALVDALVTLHKSHPATAPGAQVKGNKAKRADAIAAAQHTVRGTLSRRPWSWLAAQPLDLLHADDLAVLVGPHLAAATTDERVSVRIAVATHADVDEVTLTALAEDPDGSVRQAVTMRILKAAGLTDQSP